MKENLKKKRYRICCQEKLGTKLIHATDRLHFEAGKNQQYNVVAGTDGSRSTHAFDDDKIADA